MPRSQFWTGLNSKHPQTAAFAWSAKHADGHSLWVDEVSAGHRRYFVCGREDVFDWLMGEEKRALFEILSGPCHLVFDLDGKIDVNPQLADATEVEWLCSDLLSRIRSAVRTAFGDDEADDLVIVWLDASNNHKFSKHLLVKMKRRWFASIVAAGAFMFERVWQPMIRDEPEVWQRYSVATDGQAQAARVCLVDLKIYTQNRPFRTLLSSKFGERRPLLLSAGDQPITRDLFLSTLGQHWGGAEPPEVVEWDGDTRPLKHHHHKRGLPTGSATPPGAKRTRRGGPAVSQLPAAVAAAVKEVIANQVGGGSDIYREQFDREALKVTISVKTHLCWIKGRGSPMPHRSNHTYFTCHLPSLTVVQRCGDDACCQQRGAFLAERTFPLTAAQGATIEAWLQTMAVDRYGGDTERQRSLVRIAPSLFSGVA